MKSKRATLAIVLLVLLVSLVASFQNTQARSTDPAPNPNSANAPMAVKTWARTYGGTGNDSAQSILPTSDGYILVGFTSSFGAGNYDAWVLKLGANGNLLWQKTYGGTSIDGASSIAPSGDGGYIVAGQTQSFSAGYSDVWVLKLDGSGNLLWQKTYGGIGYDSANSVAPTGDGGYVVIGQTQSFGTGDYDAWVLKLDGSGNLLWQKTYGGTNSDYAYSVAPAGDGGYIVAGSTFSFGAGFADMWVLKLDGSGNLLWQKTYGGVGYDFAYSVAPAGDGGYIVAGETNSFGAGFADAWVLKLDASGNVLWQKTYGGVDPDVAESIAPTGDGDYIVAGDTASFGGGNNDLWVLKLDANGNLLWLKTYGALGFDYGLFITPTGDGGYIFAGQTQFLGAWQYDAWVLKLDANGNINDPTMTGCRFVRASGATPTASAGIAANSPVTPVNSSATPAASAATPAASSATPVATSCR